jgi:hypothetical protein
MNSPAILLAPDRRRRQPGATSEFSAMDKHITIECIRSETVVVRIKAGMDVRKIINIVFSKRDGSLFTNFPYFAHSAGRLCIATFEADQTSRSISFDQEGKCTSHLVKYTHHRSGEALFSQTGKVNNKNTIRRASVPLDSVRGHIFTVYAQGMSHFMEANTPNDLADHTKKRANITFDVGNQMPETIKLVAQVYQASLLAGMIIGDPPDRIGPRLPLRMGNGDLICGFGIGNPHNMRDQTLLCITCQSMPRLLDRTPQGAMLFIGGFDPPEQATASDRRTSFLAFSYPTDNFDEIRQRLGSIDYRP